MKLGKLEVIVLVSGAVVMVVEILGSRIVAPFFGSSLYVWTSLIGVVMASLSLGYFLGGRVSRKDPSFKTISLIFFTASLLVALLAVFKDAVLFLFTGTGTKIGSLAVSAILFGPVSVLLGAISPIAVRIKTEKAEEAGAESGALYAISTFGSIVGTFLAGFFLIPSFGITFILGLMSFVLFSLSLLAFSGPKKTAALRTLVIIVPLLLLAAPVWGQGKYVYSGESSYASIRVQDSTFEGRPVRYLIMDTEFHSAIYLDTFEPVFDYVKFYRHDKNIYSNIKGGLIIGGGTGVAAMDFSRRFPEARVDIVEIDPKVSRLGEKYFGYKESPQRVLYNEDARTFLRKAQALGTKYDVIYGDAFRSYYSVPYNLTTLEAIKNMYNILNDDGFVMVNVISSLEGEKSDFFLSELKTYKQVFARVVAYHLSTQSGPNSTQNIMLVALKKDVSPETLGIQGEYFLPRDLRHSPVLTDDYAPVEYFISKLVVN